jgi:hypothetical protein
MNALTIPVTVASVLVVGACGLPLASAAPYTTLMPKSGPCELVSGPNDLIVWQHVPGFPDYSHLSSAVDGLNCKPALETWKGYQPNGPGYCNKIAWASDNPGYPVDSRYAPPLKNVIDQVGDGC